MFKEFNYDYYKKEAEIDKQYEETVKTKNLIPEGCNVSFGNCDRNKRDQFLADLEYFFGS